MPFELAPKTVVAGIVLVVLWTAEGLIPFYEEFEGSLRERLRHDFRNVALGVLTLVMGNRG